MMMNKKYLLLISIVILFNYTTPAFSQEDPILPFEGGTTEQETPSSPGGKTLQGPKTGNISPPETINPISGSGTLVEYKLIQPGWPFNLIFGGNTTIRSDQGFPRLISNLTGILVTIGSILAFVFFSTGAIVYMWGGLTDGHAGSLEKGKKFMTNSIIGLLFLLASYLIISRVNVQLLTPTALETVLSDIVCSENNKCIL